MNFGNKVVSIAIAVFITIAILTEVQGSIATATGTGGVFENTATGTLMTLIPLVIVAGLLGVAWIKNR